MNACLRPTPSQRWRTVDELIGQSTTPFVLIAESIPLYSVALLRNRMALQHCQPRVECFFQEYVASEVVPWLLCGANELYSEQIQYVTCNISNKLAL